MDIPSIPDDASSLPLTGTSAFVGEPPSTQNDYFIVKGLFRMAGMTTANPMTGYSLVAKQPPDYSHETKLPGVLAGLVFVILAIVAPTVARAWLRLRKGSVMQFGCDDWTIIVAAVRARQMIDREYLHELTLPPTACSSRLPNRATSFPRNRWSFPPCLGSHLRTIQQWRLIGHGFQDSILRCRGYD